MAFSTGQQVTAADLNNFSVTTVTTSSTITSGGAVTVPDEAYDATAWNGALTVPTKNAVRDKIEAIASGVGVAVCVAAYNSGQQTVATTSTTALTLDSEDVDTDTMHDTASNTSRLTAPSTGKYLITASITVEANNNPEILVRVRKNGATMLNVGWRAQITGSQVTRQTIGSSLVASLSATDYVELVMINSTSDTVTVGLSTAPTTFGMVKLGT